MLKLNKISKDYRAAGTVVHALKNIDLEFRKNEFVSILGPSGCGKTTLLNLIGGLDKYTGGDLLINNKSTKKFSDQDWDSYRNYNVGFVFQNYNLIGHLSILQNVEIALSLAGFSKKEREEKAKKALENVGLSTELNKSPNQLSGGQMQRVAIARALVNDPDILLADEPTGALDTVTSVQIMDIIQEIAKDRLVIMVTHNPELAKEYSNRTITLLDGEITGDDNPYHKSLDEKVVPLKNKGTSMSFLTALSLSFRNLRTKKVKTLITAIAGSIGIIGVALVLSLSNGFNNYIDKLQTDTLSSNPLTISEGSVNSSAMINALLESGNKEKFPSIEKIFNNRITAQLATSMASNDITPEYVDYVASFDKSYTYDINYSTGLDLDKNIYTTAANDDSGKAYSLYSTSVPAPFNELPDNMDFIKGQYDVIAGRLPTSKTDLTLVVDSTNTLYDYQLYALKLDGSASEINFSDVLGKEYYFMNNNYSYTENSNGTFTRKTSISDNSELSNGLKLTITGVIRINKSTTMGSASQGLVYTRELTKYALSQNLDTNISKYNIANPTIDPTKGTAFTSDSQSTGNFGASSATDKAKAFAGSIGATERISEISIYCKDFASKTAIKDGLDEYNVMIKQRNISNYTGDVTQMSDVELNAGVISYDDIMAIFMQSLNQLINIITYVLIAFSSIALIVSSVMIGVITYSSVVERTKEIGILRSVGARKKDISRVFNAETFIIGLYSGVIGIVVTYLVSIPINIILNSKVSNIGQISNLDFKAALILIGISIVLSLLAGLIPSGIAARKDPVTALRTD